MQVCEASSVMIGSLLFVCLFSQWRRGYHSNIYTVKIMIGHSARPMCLSGCS